MNFIDDKYVESKFVRKTFLVFFLLLSIGMTPMIGMILALTFSGIPFVWFIMGMILIIPLYLYGAYRIGWKLVEKNMGNSKSKVA